MRAITCFQQWAVWGEPHPDHLPHVHRPAHTLHTQHPGRGFYRRRQVAYTRVIINLLIWTQFSSSIRGIHLFIILFDRFTVSSLIIRGFVPVNQFVLHSYSQNCQQSTWLKCVTLTFLYLNGLTNIKKSFLLPPFCPPLQTGAGLWPPGLCLWAVSPGGVHVDLHVRVCVTGSFYAVPDVGPESVWLQ